MAHDANVPPASDAFLSWLRGVSPSGPTKAWALKMLGQERADLPERVVEASLNGQIDGSFWFTAHDVLEWLGIIDPLSAARVPAGFFVAHLDDSDSRARNGAAAGLAMASPSRALEELEARIASKKATDRQTALSLAYRVFTARGADASAARKLLPRLVAAAEQVKGKSAVMSASATIEAVTACAARVDTSGLGDREDLTTLAAHAPTDPAIEARLALGTRTLDPLRPGRADDRRIDFSLLAGIAGLSLEMTKAHAARLCLAPEHRLAWTERGLYWQDSAFFESVQRPHPVSDQLGISPWAIEKLVLARDTAKLDVVLVPWARLRGEARHTSSKAPALKWLDGKPLSPTAQAFFLGCHAQASWRSIAELLSSLLDDDASFELGRWLLSDGVAHAGDHFLLPPSRRLAQEVARAAEHDLLPRELAEYHGLEGLASFRRSLMRRWATRRGTWRSSYLRPSTMLFGGAPTDEEIAQEQPGSTALWERLVADAFEDAMVAQHAFVAHALERLSSNPLVRRAIRGVVFALEGRGLAWLGERGFESPAGPFQPEGHLSVVVAHPLLHGALPETGIETSFAQKNRPTFDAHPSEVSLPGAIWRERTHTLGYCEKVALPGDGASNGAWRSLVHSSASFELDHLGMSKSPVTLASAHVKAMHSPSALERSELALDVHRLAGLLPLAPLPEPAPVPAPEVLDAAFWNRAG